MDLFRRLRRAYETAGTISGVARKFGVHRRTVRTALKCAVPPKRKVPQRDRPKMALVSPSIDAILDIDQKAPWIQRHTAQQIWTKIRADAPKVHVSASTVRKYVRARKIQLGFQEETSARFAAGWLLRALHSKYPLSAIDQQLQGANDLLPLFRFLKHGSPRERTKALAIIACLKGIRTSVIANCLKMSRKTIRRYLNRFERHGADALFAKRQSSVRKQNDEERKQFLFATLHSPPSTYGINRTSWKMDDLHRILAANGYGVCKPKIRAMIKEAGFRWLKARRVLTSHDPAYKEKIARINCILTNLGPRELFFSIDEFGPFSITRRCGRKLVGPGEVYVVPQHQEPKGRVIVTAALELSTNQITHFYSNRKNTDEMIRLLRVLLNTYTGFETLYLSWDAASWHLSRRFYEAVAEANTKHRLDSEWANVELAPLPAGAQFLNVIESVFSGMAKAIIHNSDYCSSAQAMLAIDKYFEDRNAHFRQNPRRAGNKIWGRERVRAVFAEDNNCKDPCWR